MRLIKIIWAAGLAATPACAQSAPPNVVYTDLSAVSDYRYDGLSNSNRHGAVQASAYLWRPDNFFAGVFASSVDNGAAAEIDVYGGHKFDVGPTQYSLQLLGAHFTQQRFRAFVPTYDFLQATASAERHFGPLRLKAALSWTPDGSASARQAWRIAGEGDYALRPWLSLGGRIGTTQAVGTADRTFWDFGATLSSRDLSFDLRYVDSSASPAQCFGMHWCAAAWVGKLTWHIPVHPAFG